MSLSHNNATCVPLGGVHVIDFHPRIADLISTCQKIGIRCLPWDRNAVTLGHYPHLVDVQVEVLEVPDYGFVLDIFRCYYWRTKERFHFVACGTGYLFSKLTLKGIPLHDKF